MELLRQKIIELIKKIDDKKKLQIIYQFIRGLSSR